MTADLKTGRSIQEFWIDFLLEEEFGCDPTFAAAFASACGLALDADRSILVAHSVCDEFGEADLVVRFHIAGSGESAALLLENKITASFQPEQALRYRRRGDHGVSQGLWQHYSTVLIAPARYIQANHGFDNALSLETISEWVCRADPARRSYKVARLQRAIDKKNATGVQVVDPVMTDFRDWYGQQLMAFGSGFVPPAPRPAYWDDNWMEWISEELAEGWRFRHRTRSGVIDLSNADFTIDDFENIRGQLPSGSTFCTVGKSRAGIATKLRAIVDFADHSVAKPIVQEALSTADAWQKLIATL